MLNVLVLVTIVVHSFPVILLYAQYSTWFTVFCRVFSGAYLYKVNSKAF